MNNVRLKYTNNNLIELLGGSLSKLTALEHHLRKSFSLPRSAEFLVCSDLERFGFQAVPFPGACRDSDIIAYHPGMNVTLLAQAKHTEPTSVGFNLRIPYARVGEYSSRNLIWVFVLFHSQHLNQQSRLVFEDSELFTLLRSSPRLGSSDGRAGKETTQKYLAEVNFNADGVPFCGKLNLQPYLNDQGWSRAISAVLNRDS